MSTEFDFVRVEYEIEGCWFGKTMHIQSEHLCNFHNFVEPAISVTSVLVPPPAPEFSPTRNVELRMSHDQFQGNRVALPIECEGGPFNYYVKMDYIWTLLDRRNVVLIRGGWLLEKSKTIPFRPLPCRQELQAEAVVDIVQLRKFAESCQSLPNKRVGEVWPSIVAISHCWITREHPDPDGLLLRELAPIVDAYLRTHRYWFPDVMQTFDGAFFFAWCSVHQVGHHDVTKQEMALFQEALENMDIWYTHAHTETWMLTKVLCGERPYEERGWPTWERIVSQLLTTHNGVLDLGVVGDAALEDGVTEDKDAYPKIMGACAKTSRSPPLLPEEFAKLISIKTFTKGNADCKRIIENYERNFGHAMSCVTNLDFFRLGWGDIEARSLARVLPRCPNLEVLDLRGNAISDAGACLIAESIIHCPKLKLTRMHLIGNPMSGDMKRKLVFLTHSSRQ